KFFLFQAEDGIRDRNVTGVQTCALPICLKNMSEAERQNYLATEEAQRAVHILLVSNVAQSYFNQQLAYAQLQIAEETLRNYQQRSEERRVGKEGRSGEDRRQ